MDNKKQAGKMIATAFDEYKARVIPQGASEIQIEETRMAFYAGATALFSGIIIKLSPGAEPTEGDIEVMEQTFQELQDYAASIKCILP